MTLLVSSDMVFWLCVLVAAKSVLRLSYNKLEHQFEWHPWTCVLGVKTFLQSI